MNFLKLIVKLKANIKTKPNIVKKIAVLDDMNWISFMLSKI